ncbi:MAG: Tfp pilus assembly protein FimT/FimU [Candidatus Methylomirabilales bacterium]
MPRGAVVRGWNRQVGRMGFTAIELLVGMAVAAVLIGVAIPSFQTLMQSYRLNGAARQVVSEIRAAQSLAVKRADVFGFHWGGDPDVTNYSNGEYRIERRAGTACTDWPDQDATMDNLNVITNWFDLSGEFRGVTITSIQDSGGNDLNGVVFNSRGASVGACGGPPVFPLTVTLSNGSGETRSIQVKRTGSVKVL